MHCPFSKILPPRIDVPGRCVVMRALQRSWRVTTGLQGVLHAEPRPASESMDGT